MKESEPAAPGSRIVIRDAYQTQYSDPISFSAGDEVQVRQSDSEHPDWYWCRGPDDREGWVHESLLSRREGVAAALEDYSARELNVRTGERGRVLRALGGWLHVEMDDGSKGWVPERVTTIAP